MKFFAASAFALLLTSAFPQAEVYAQGSIQVPIPNIPGVTPQQRPPQQQYDQRDYRNQDQRDYRSGGQRESCDSLRGREHEINRRLDTARGGERDSLERRLRQVRDDQDRERCR
jgi:hypothetical protein